MSDLKPFAITVTGNKKFIIIAEDYENAMDLFIKEMKTLNVFKLARHADHKVEVKKIGENVFFHCLPCDIVFYNTSEHREEFHGTIVTIWDDPDE